MHERERETEAHRKREKEERETKRQRHKERQRDRESERVEGGRAGLNARMLKSVLCLLDDYTQLCKDTIGVKLHYTN